jgi:hypothetical protein
MGSHKSVSSLEAIFSHAALPQNRIHRIIDRGGHEEKPVARPPRPPALCLMILVRPSAPFLANAD